MSDIIVKVSDLGVGSSALCRKGARNFFARHNLDWGDFVRNGIPMSKLEATRDPLAKPAMERAKARHGAK